MRLKTQMPQQGVRGWFVLVPDGKHGKSRLFDQLNQQFTAFQDMFFVQSALGEKAGKRDAIALVPLQTEQANGLAVSAKAKGCHGDGDFPVKQGYLLWTSRLNRHHWFGWP